MRTRSARGKRLVAAPGGAQAPVAALALCAWDRRRDDWRTFRAD